MDDIEFTSLDCDIVRLICKKNKTELSGAIINDLSSLDGDLLKFAPTQMKYEVVDKVVEAYSLYHSGRIKGMQLIQLIELIENSATKYLLKTNKIPDEEEDDDRDLIEFIPDF